MNPPHTVAQVLADTGPILLDFDGPVCAVFATVPDHAVADELRRVLQAAGIEIPHHVQTASDPLDVLRFTATLDTPELVARVDDQMRAAELVAVDGATPTPYAREVIVAAHQAGRPLAIVSNNSTDAIARYLDAHRLTRYLTAIIGRPHANPAGMKPNPEPVRHAVQAVHADPATCVLIGDSTTDIQAARAAGTRSIGYANKPGKRDRLTNAGADAITEGPEGMAEMATALLNVGL